MLDHSLFYHSLMLTKTWHRYLTQILDTSTAISHSALHPCTKCCYAQDLTSPSLRNTPNSISPQNFRKYIFPNTPRLKPRLTLFCSQSENALISTTNRPPGDSELTLPFPLLFLQTVSSSSPRNVLQ